MSIHMNARIIKQKCVTASYKIQISNKKKQKTKQIKNPVKISRLSKKISLIPIFIAHVPTSSDSISLMSEYFLTDR